MNAPLRLSTPSTRSASRLDLRGFEARRIGDQIDRDPAAGDAERAALALTEAATRLSDRSDPVPDEVWNEAAKHYDERALSALVLSIAVTNLFNRINVSTRQPAGAWG